MASGGTLKYSYNGKQYTKELDPPNQEKIDQYTRENIAKMGASGNTQSGRDLAYRDAVKRERNDRVDKAKREVMQANAAKAAMDEEAKDTGISQRQTTPDTAPAGTKEDGDNETKPTNTDADQMGRLQTFADKLNATVYQYPKRGYVTKKVEPSGVGSFLDQVTDMAFQASGHGGQQDAIFNIFHNHDRFGKSFALRNTEFPGYTFITRPRLNLSDYNLMGDRRFYSMRTDDNRDTSYAVRCMLDTRFSSEHDCPLIDKRNPFSVLLCNGIVSISGYNDPFLATETTDGGFFQEDQTYAIGGDRMARTYDLVLTFRDFPGGPVSYAFDMWYQYVMDIQDGTMIQYADAIDANRMDYTVSIYRFVLNSTRKVITRWSKATGCFPVNAPTGVVFNANQGETYVQSTENFGITFKANRIEYNDPIIMHEFNMLVRRYNPGISKGASVQAYAYEAQNNFMGIPYIRASDLGHELVFLRQGSDGGSIIRDSGTMPTYKI